MTDTLRGYQVDVIAEIERAIAAGERRILLVAPTGSGKTIIGGEFIGLLAKLSLGSGAGASAGNHHADQRQAARPQHPARHHQGGVFAAADGAGAGRVGADLVGAGHALGCHATAARQSPDR